MAIAFAGGATAIMRFIVNSFSIVLRLAQTCFDYEPNGAGDSQVFENFSLLGKSVACTKLFLLAYRSVHTDGFGMLASSCLIGLSIYLFTIVIHLYRNHRSLAKAWMIGMALLLTAGFFLLVVKIPNDYAWHNTTVEAILVLFICLDALLLVINMMSEHGCNENLLRGLLMIVVETIINVCLFADYLGKTHSPWNAEKILHLFGSCMSVLSGLGQIGWIAYKYLASRVFGGGEEQPAGAAIDSDVEQQTVEEVAEVVEQGDKKTIWSPARVDLFSRLVPWGRKKSEVFARETEMSAGAATEDDGGGHQHQGEEVPPEEETTPA